VTADPHHAPSGDSLARGGTRLAGHTLISFAGYAIPLAVAVVAIPITARELGAVRFGLLGMAWALIEYLSFVDLALGRTSVRFVAAALTLGSRGFRQIVSVAVAAQGVAGLVAAVVLAAVAGPLATGVFNIPPELRVEATGMFRAVAANLVVVVLTGALRGTLEGAQRFDLSNAIKVPSATAAVLIPALGAVAGISLPAMLWLVFAVRVVILAFAFSAVPKALPGFAWEVPRELHHLRDMFSYSAWLAVSGVINPVLVAFDRLALATLLGAAAVGYYTAPYEAATRLLAVAISAFAVLFPAVTSNFVRSEAWRTQRVLESVLRQMALVFSVPVILLFVFAPELLAVWVGPEFADRGATPFRILLVGVAANALAHVPFVFLYATGRPDLPAKNHIGELILHIPLTLLLIRRFGVTGAAAAWTIRVLLDASLLTWMAARRKAFWTSPAAARLWLVALIAIGLLGALSTIARLLAPATSTGAAVLVVTGLGVFTAVGWFNALAPEERLAWAGLVAGLRGFRRRRGQRPR
jgi:O-antigen/teichoic acid export membrane protein